MNGIDFAILLKAIHSEGAAQLFSTQFDTSRLLDSARQSSHAFKVFEKPVHARDFLDPASNLYPGEVN